MKKISYGFCSGHIDEKIAEFAKDSVLKEKRDRWHEALSKDIYVEEALNAGVKIIQFRNKIQTDNEIEQTAINLQKLCTNYDALFVMNDRVQLTGKLKLDAVHIGIEDISLIDARKIVGTNCIIGVSCYGNIELAKNAALQGADYVAFGACFSSTTKPQNKTIDKNVISIAKSILDIPVCVIGGIAAHNIEELKKQIINPKNGNNG